jgi:hypothetical protein
MSDAAGFRAVAVSKKSTFFDTMGLGKGFV